MLESIGRPVLRLTEDVGQVVLLLGLSGRAVVTGQLHWRNTLQQLARIGTESVGLILVSSAFIGAVFTVQVTTEFSRLGALKLIGGIVGLAMWRELSPIFTGLVVAGRVGAAITAEIGTMKVSEQIEALRAMAVDPDRYLAVPRIVAALIMVPLLTGVSDVVGFLAGLVIAVYVGKLNPNSYFSSAQNMLSLMDITGGLVKAALFGVLIAAVACHLGARATAGAQGVGSATTRTVVISFMLIFTLNYILSVLLYS